VVRGLEVFVGGRVGRGVAGVLFEGCFMTRNVQVFSKKLRARALLAWSLGAGLFGAGAIGRFSLSALTGAVFPMVAISNRSPLVAVIPVLGSGISQASAILLQRLRGHFSYLLVAGVRMAGSEIVGELFRVRVHGVGD